MAKEAEAVGVHYHGQAMPDKEMAKMLEVVPSGVSGDEDRSQEFARMVIHSEQEGLLPLVRPPLVDGRIVLPQFADAGAFPAPPSFGTGFGLRNEIGKVGSGKGGNGLPVAFKTEACFQFISHELKVGRLLEGKELLEEANGFQRPGRPVVATRELCGEPGAFSEEAGAEPVKVGAADLEVVGGIRGVNMTLVELPEDLLEERVGQAFGDLLLLIAASQSRRCPLVEGFRRPSLRSGLLNPSTNGQISTLDHLSPFELPPVSFCSRPDSGFCKSQIRPLLASRLSCSTAQLGSNSAR
jgi:hypothetical protein